MCEFVDNHLVDDEPWRSFAVECGPNNLFTDQDMLSVSIASLRDVLPAIPVEHVESDDPQHQLGRERGPVTWFASGGYRR